MRYLSSLIIFVFVFFNIFFYIPFVKASWFFVSYQKVSLDTSSSFTNQQDNLWVNPEQYFRFESNVQNTTWLDVTNITYYSNYPSWIIYNSWTTAATQINWSSTFVIPTWSFYPNLIPNYQDNSTILTNNSIFQMRRVLLKFPSDWSVYENTLSNYYTASWWYVSDTKLTTIWVNVRPHIVDYYFEKNDSSATTNQVQWSNAEPINLVVKVKDYNWCSNISAWSVVADLSQLWLTSSETLTYDSCDWDWYTAIFKKSWITTNATLWDYNFDYTKFTATDINWNINTPNDPNTIFDDEDKKTTMILSVVPSLSPIVSFVSLSNSVVWWPEKTTTDLVVTSTSSWSIKLALWSNWSCVWWTTLSDWSSYTENTNKTFTINSSSLTDWANSIYVCLSNNGYTWSLLRNITKDITAPIISWFLYTSAVTTNDSIVRFYCSEDWQFATEIWWNWVYWSWTWTSVWWASSVSVQNIYTMSNSYLTQWPNTVYWYCKDNASNISYSTWTITKTVPVLSMSWMVNSFADNDIDYNWLDWRDITVTWSKPAWDISNFYSYLVYILPSNVTFNSSTHWNNYIKSVTDENTLSYTWISTNTKDATNTTLVSWGYYKACIAIIWDDVTYWEVWCSAPAVLTSDTVQNAKVTSAKFSSSTNLELTTDATMDTTLSTHSWSLISYVYNWTTYSWTSVSSVNWTKINITIPALNNVWATWWTLLLQTWALHSAWWWYNNYFSSWTLVITDGQTPTVTSFINNTTSPYNSFYSWTINVWFTFAEQMKDSWYTKIVFDRTAWNASSQKIFWITTASNLTSWSKTRDLTLNWTLVSWTTYNMYLYWEDLAWNSVTSTWITVKFDNVWPAQTSIIDTLNTSSTTPTLSWTAPTDDSWNGSWVWSYVVKVYNSSDCSWTATQTLSSSTVSKTTNALTNWTYSWNVYAVDNVWNIWTTSTCDSFIVDTSIPTITNLKITDTTLNSTTYGKAGDTIIVTATLTNTNSWKITANLSALTWNSSHTAVSCANPVSWVTCSYNAWALNYSFILWYGWSVTEAVRQTTLNVSNPWDTNSTSAVSSITVDNTNPTSWTISSPSWTIWWNSNNIVWSGISDTNLDYLKFEYSSNGWSNYTLIWTWSNSSPRVWDTSALSSGTNYKVKITAYDRATNQSVTETSTFTIDKDWPTISAWTITAPTSGEYVKWSSTYNITWNSGNITDVWWLQANPIQILYSTDSTNWISIASSLPNTWSYSWSVPSINSATVKLRMIVTDNVWNTSTFTNSTTFIIDSTLPTFSVWVSTPPNGKYVNANWFTIEWTATDTNLKRISYSFQRVSDSYYWDWSSYTWTSIWNTLQDNISASSYNINTLVTPSITDGSTYDLTIKAVDYAWNEIQSTTRRYTWDTTNPTLNISTSSWTYFKDSLTISWISSDGWSWLSSVKISIKKGSDYFDWTDWGWTATQLTTTTSNSYANWTYSFNPPVSDTDWQNYEVTVYAYDSSYKVNNSSSSSIWIILDTSAPSIASTLFTFDTWSVYIWWNTLNITWNTSDITTTWASLASTPIWLEYFDNPNWISIASNLSNNWTYNFTLPSLDASDVKIRLSATDSVWNVVYKNSSSFTVDSTPPSITEIQTMDQDADGQIDWVKVILSESIKDSTINVGDFTLWSWIWTPTSWSTWNSSNDDRFILSFSNTWTTSTRPTLSYVNWNLTDIAWKHLLTISNVSSTDKSVPRILKAESYDVNSNWKLDKIAVTFSENISSTTDTTAFSVNWKTISSVSVSSDVANIIINEESDYDTWVSGLTLDFISNANWQDIYSNQAWSLWSSLNVIDKAEPILVSWIIYDQNSDYVADKIVLTFSESLTWTLAWFSLSSWNIDTTTLSWTTQIILWVSSISWTNPNITLNYTWDINDGASNNLSSISSYSLSEQIPPKLLSSKTIDDDNNWKIDKLNLNFSENITWSFSDFAITVNSYSLASSSVYSFSWSTDVVVSLSEKQIFDSEVTPLVTIDTNTSLKDNSNNIATSGQSVTSTDWVWPVIISARFDEWTKNLYLNFSENVTTSLDDTSFSLNSSTANISSVTFTPGNSTATLVLSNTWITYGSSEISFSYNTASDTVWNKQAWFYYTKISASVVVNEFMWNWDVKYIELKNISSTSVDISWWIIQNALSWTWLVIDSYTIPANSYYLIATENTYFSWVTANQIASLNYSSNLVLKNWNITVDSALYQAWTSNIAYERSSSCSNSLSSSCWYEAVASNGFVNNTYKWTPWTDNILDATLPSITSTTPTNDTIYPFVPSINVSFDYEDDASWVWINSWSVYLSLEKYDWSSWNTDNSITINTWSVTNTQANFTLSWFNTYWRYRANLKVSDFAWNEVSENIIFYVDKFSFTLDKSSIDLWVLTSWNTKLSDQIVTVTVKTIWAWFTLTHTTTNPSNFASWTWSWGYGWCIGNWCSTLEDFSNKQVVSQAKSLQSSWSLATYTYEIRYWSLIDSLQAAWVYNFVNENKIELSY